MVAKAPTNETACIGDHKHVGEDKFSLIFPNTDWNQCLSYAEKIGVGNIAYDLEDLG